MLTGPVIYRTASPVDLRREVPETRTSSRGYQVPKDMGYVLSSPNIMDEEDRTEQARLLECQVAEIRSSKT